MPQDWMTPQQRGKMASLVAEHDRPDQGRNIDELISSRDPVKGMESQRLRTYCTSNCMEPSRDLDDYGAKLFRGNIDAVQQDYRDRIEHLTQSGTPAADARTLEAARLADLTWGPTRVPIFNFLLLARTILPDEKDAHLAIAKWLAAARADGGAGVPVDSADLSGTTALSYAISTKPFLDLAFAQLLHDAGGDVTHRNRYGATAAEAICMVYAADAETVERHARALRWFLAHGGNMWVADNDGNTAWNLVRQVQRAYGARMARFAKVMDAEHERRRKERNICCEFCGRVDAVKLLQCSRCRKVRYCAPPERKCQKADWKRHKPECIP